MMVGDIDAAIRLVLALILGAIVGGERQWRRKSAGLRTHVLVSMGSCLVMILSINLYRQVQGFTNADPARLAAQVVSGIGFLGAGTIMKEGLTVVGLTTAASLWIVAAIGLAVGSGYMVCALVTTALSYATLTWLSRFEKKFINNCDVYLTITSLDRPGQVGRIGSYLGEHGVGIKDIRVIEHRQEQLIIGIVICNLENDNTIMQDLIELDGIVEVKRDS
ncbi:MAG: MgtC/SapB family protein [Sporomusaceae bacterium]|nr:MgtC/SapB family protein [Sporomusaceae bacterium]